MQGINQLAKLQKDATLREYAIALHAGNLGLAGRIKDANSKWITADEFKQAKI